MKHSLFITAACLLLAQNGAAYGETPHEGKVLPAGERAVSIPERRTSVGTEELSERLDQILSQALDAQILTAPGQAVAEDNGPDAPETPETEQVEARPAPRASYSCPAEYPLDFEDFKSISRYQDLERYRVTVAASPDNEARPPINEQMLKAYLVLGLNAEALADLQLAEGSRAMALRQLAHLLEDRQPPDVDFFREMAGCHDQAGLWLAIALIVDKRPEGPALMSEYITAYRKLPHHLRIDVAAMTVPALEASGELTLARTLLSDFAPGEIEKSPRLQFTKALLNMGEGNPAAEDAVRSFLAQAEFRIDALAALSQHGGNLSDVEKVVLLNEVERVLGYAEDERDIAVALRFSLGELSMASDYPMMLKLADLPALQTQPAQDEIKRQLLSDLKRDLNGDSSLRKMAAIDALLSDSDLLRDVAGLQELYLLGSDFASGAGYHGVAEQLLLASGEVPLSDRKRAENSFRTGNNSELFRLAAAYPQDGDIALMAALAAIRSGDSSRLKQYESRFLGDPDALLAMLEMDAVKGRWIVSAELYDAGSVLEDDQLRARAERAAHLRKAATSRPEGMDGPRPATIGDALVRSREAFRHLNKEGL